MKEDGSPTNRLLSMVLLIILITRIPITTLTATVLLAMSVQWPVVKYKNAASLETEKPSRNVAAKLLSEESQLHPCEEVWLRGGCNSNRKEELEGEEGEQECICKYKTPMPVMLQILLFQWMVVKDEAGDFFNAEAPNSHADAEP